MKLVTIGFVSLIKYFENHTSQEIYSSCCVLGEKTTSPMPWPRESRIPFENSIKRLSWVLRFLYSIIYEVETFKTVRNIKIGFRKKVEPQPIDIVVLRSLLPAYRGPRQFCTSFNSWNPYYSATWAQISFILPSTLDPVSHWSGRVTDPHGPSGPAAGAASTFPFSVVDTGDPKLRPSL